MRIPSRTPWLVTSVIANVAATDSFNFTQSSFVGFPSGDLTTSVFDISSLDYKQFSWVMTTSVTIQSIYLGIQNTSIVVGENKTVSGTPYGGSIQNRDATIPLQFNASLWSSGEGGYIAFGAEDFESLNATYPREPFFFQVHWVGEDDPTNDEYSYSQTWGLAHDAQEAIDMYNANFQLGYGASPTAQGTSALLSVLPQTPTVGPSSATATSPVSTTGTSAGLSSKSNSQGKYGLLSEGALIGVIVGSVAFLVLVIIIIAILCIRRRRRNVQDQGPHERDNQDLMAEKEARAAGTAPDTPYSIESSQPLNRGRGIKSGHNENAMSMPRSLADEWSQRSSVVYSSLRNVTSVGTGLGGDDSVAGEDSGDSPTATNPSSSISLHEPYADLVQDQFDRTTALRATADHPVISPENEAETEQTPLSPGSIRDESRPRASGSRTGTPQLGPTRPLVRSDTPGGMSISDYLHEDGMTEDEIKRLEEEERALDEAIEQARTDSRTGLAR